MGVKLSIDKHVSDLEDILEMSPHYLSRVQFESKIQAEISQHLKIWRFFESKKALDQVKSAPVPLYNISDDDHFQFNQEECYLVFLIYLNGTEQPNDLKNYPQSLVEVAKSTGNLSPRGLKNIFASNIEYLEQSSLDSFLLTKRNHQQSARENEQQQATRPNVAPTQQPDQKTKKRGSQKSQSDKDTSLRGGASSQSNSNSASQGLSDRSKYKYMLYIWNGKHAQPVVKAQTLTKGYAFDEYLHQAKDSGLNVLFSGGVVKNKKLQRGNIYVFEDIIDQKMNQHKPSKKQNALMQAQQSSAQKYKRLGEVQNEQMTDNVLTVYNQVNLLKWLFPEIMHEDYRNRLALIRQGKFPNFNESYIAKDSKSSSTESTARKAGGAAGQQKRVSIQQQSTKKQGMQKSSSYWSRFEILDDQETLSADDQASESDDGDIEMKDLEGRAAQNIAYNRQMQQFGSVNNDEDMLNQEIEDIDSDDDQLLVMQQQQNQMQHKQTSGNKVPGLQLGGIQLGTIGGGALPSGAKLQLNQGGNGGQKQPNQKIHAATTLTDNMLDAMSGRQSSKREVTRLNIHKAIAYQQEQLQRIDHLPSRVNKNLPIVDVEDANQQRAAEPQQMANALSLKNPAMQGQPSLGIGAGLNLQDASAGKGDTPMNAPRGGQQNQQTPMDINFDQSGTSRKQYENALFNSVCSCILDDFLYLGSDEVAKDLNKLKQNGITHVINCAADYSADYHIDRGIKYLSLHLKDHVRENIECSFYEVIDFVSKAKTDGGRVFIHCVQGISRSCTMIICYMIFTQKITVEDALIHIRQRRQIANPNMAFHGQLIWFYKRLYSNKYDDLKVNPRIFLVCSHQPEDPYKIACRLQLDDFYTDESNKVLDPRAMFIVQGPPGTPVYIWQGAQLPQGNVQVYMNQAQKHIKLLQQHERADAEVRIVTQGNEDSQFWKLFFKNGSKPQPNVLYNNVNEWNNLLVNLQTINFVKQAPVVWQMEAYKDIVEEEKKTKPKLFKYPNWNESMTVFDFEDLEEADALLVLCKRPIYGDDPIKAQNKVFIWRGSEFDNDEANHEVVNVQEFISRVMEQYWGCKSPENQFNIQIQEEIFGQESDEFMDYF